MKIKITRVLKFSFGMIPLISSYMNVSEAATTPAIYGVKIQNITATSAVVSWGTTVNMTGKVAYGLNTTYSTGSKYSGSYATYRQLSLSGLQPNTVYHYKLSDTDSSGHLIQSGDYTFTTASPSIYGVKVQNITATSAVVSWGTTANMTAKIAYGVDTNYSTGSQYSGSYNSYRQLSLSGLQPNTVYHYKLSDTDSSGHLIQSGDYTFSTIPPAIYGVKVQNITATTAVVSWGTTVNMSSKVTYGLDTNYSAGSKYSGSYDSYRQLSLSGLQANTVYHYKLSDKDSTGHYIQSGDYTLTTAPATPPETNSYFTLYLSPYGNDSYDGKTSGSAVLTLSRIQSILKSVDPSSSVQVIIAPGTYYNQRTSWNYTHSQYSIEFMTTSGNEGLAIFDGCPGPNISLPSSQCTGGTFFNLSSSTGESTNLIFHGLKIQNYWAGITFVGNSSSPSLSNWNNRIENCEFNNIGNVFNPNLSYGMYAVELWNSHSNIIQNNKFNNIINVNNEGWLHGVYASIYANDNQILGNTFNKVTGDPIRIRNRSNNNIVQGNVFIQSRIYGSYSDWYCRPDEGYNCDMLECPSWNNQFSSNTYGYNYVGDNIQPTAVFQSNNEWMSYSINKFSPCFSQ